MENSTTSQFEVKKNIFGGFMAKISETHLLLVAESRSGSMIYTLAGNRGRQKEWKLLSEQLRISRLSPKATVGGEAYRTFLELIITHFTTETWAYSKGFAFFRIIFCHKKTPLANSLFENLMVS